MDTSLGSIESRSAGDKVVKSVMGGSWMFNEKGRKEAYSERSRLFFGRVGRESSERIGIWLDLHEKFMQTKT